MQSEKPIYEPEEDVPDPDEVPIKNRKVVTQPYDLVVESLVDQINGGTIFLRPLTDRPSFQREYVWPDKLASRLIESILLNVPIPPCYLSQNKDFELDVIDGQQRLYSIYRYMENQFSLRGLEVLGEFNGCQFHKLPANEQRKLKTHTLRLVLVTNESHPEIKYDVFERLNTNTMPLYAQELRNCVYRGPLNNLLKEAVYYKPWLTILNKSKPDKRMRDEELVLRFFGFYIHGLKSYKTPQREWLNEVAMKGMNYSEGKILELREVWERTIDISLIWFEPSDCFRRYVDGAPTRAINRALFDLTAYSASKLTREHATKVKTTFRKNYAKLLENEEFTELIHRGIDHTKRTNQRFNNWEKVIGRALK